MKELYRLIFDLLFIIRSYSLYYHLFYKLFKYQPFELAVLIEAEVYVFFL